MIQIAVAGVLAALNETTWSCPDDPTLEKRLNSMPPTRRLTEAEHAGEVARAVGATVVQVDVPSSEALVGPGPVPVAVSFATLQAEDPMAIGLAIAEAIVWPDDAQLDHLTTPETVPTDPEPPEPEADVTL